MTATEQIMFYYVGVHDAGRSALLAGPYVAETDAQAAMDKARQNTVRPAMTIISPPRI